MSNSESRPLFAIGEEVILKSVAYPEYNGEYVVHKVLVSNETFESRNDGVIIERIGEGYGYLLDKVFPDVDQRGEMSWAESSLRKKYPPADFTFDELMNELKLNKTLENVD